MNGNDLASSHKGIIALFIIALLVPFFGNIPVKHFFQSVPYILL